jgi:hypothetical protein
LSEHVTEQHLKQRREFGNAAKRKKLLARVVLAAETVVELRHAGHPHPPGRRHLRGGSLRAVPLGPGWDHTTCARGHVEHKLPIASRAGRARTCKKSYSRVLGVKVSSTGRVGRSCLVMQGRHDGQEAPLRNQSLARDCPDLSRSRGGELVQHPVRQPGHDAGDQRVAAHKVARTRMRSGQGTDDHSGGLARRQPPLC